MIEDIGIIFPLRNQGESSSPYLTFMICLDVCKYYVMKNG